MQEIKKWWKKVNLGDIFEITSSKRIYFNEYTENGIPFYRSKEIIQKYNNQDINEILYISEDKFNEIKNKFWAPKEDDILLTAVWTLWIPYLVKKSDTFYFKDGNLIWFRNSKNEIINSKYFYFWIISDLWKESLKSITIWSSQSAYTIIWIKSLEILLPPLPTQQKIASILSKYDDLIENNNKRIKILEETAQSIYEEWFVKYNFPWSENIKMIDSGNDDFGMIPEVWKIWKIKDFWDVITWKTPSKSKEENYWNYMSFIKTPDLHWNFYCLNTNENLSEIWVNTQKNKIIPKNNLVISCIWTVWVVWITSKDSQTNQQINSIVLGDANNLEYLFFILRNLKPYLEKLWSNWATLLNVNKEKFSNIKVLFPNQDLLNNYSKIIKPSFNEILNLQKQNQNLKETRNMLIPRLVNGELDVESLDVK